MYNPVHKLNLSTLTKDYSITYDKFWIYLSSKKHSLPAKGWKIHISSTPSEFWPTVKKICCVVLKKNDTFKIPVNYHSMLALTTGGTKLESQGKMITIYPSDQSYSNLKDYTEKLSHILNNKKYPLVRFDYRFKDTNIFFRYGSFKLEYMTNKFGYLIPSLTIDRKKIPDNRTNLVKNKKLPFLNPPSDEKTRIINRLTNLNFEEINQVSETSKGHSFTAKYKNKRVFIKQAYSNELVDNFMRSAADRLENEYYFLKKANNIINSTKALNFIKYDNESFLIEEFFAGYPLTDYFSKGKYYNYDSNQSYNFLINLFKNIISDLAKLHNNGIIFRDISPSNILIGKDKIIFVDYELANNISNLSPYSGATPGFFDINEKGNKRLSIERDIYGLGALIFYMTTSIKPIFQEDLINKEKKMAKLKRVAFSINKNNINQLNLSMLGIEMMENPSSSLDFFKNKFYSLNSAKTFVTNDIFKLNVKYLMKYIDHQNTLYIFDKNKCINNIDSLSKTQFISLNDGIISNLLLLKNISTKKSQYAKDKCTSILNNIEKYYTSISNYDIHSLITGDVGLLYIIDWYNSFYKANNYKNLRQKIITQISSIDFNTLYTGFLYGLSGMGYTLCKIYNYSKDKKILKIIQELIDIGSKRIISTNNQIKNIDAGRINHAIGHNIINLGYGLAGLGIFFCEYLTICNNQKIRQITKNIFLYFKHTQIKKGNFTFWNQSDFDSNHYPLLFSGTAGIGLFLIKYRQLSKNDIPTIDKMLSSINFTLLNTNCIFTANILQGSAGVLLFAKYYGDKTLKDRYINITTALSTSTMDISYIFWTDPTRYNRIDYSFLTGTSGIYYALTLS